jgi:hypothetical protein
MELVTILHRRQKNYENSELIEESISTINVRSSKYEAVCALGPHITDIRHAPRQQHLSLIVTGEWRHKQLGALRVGLHDKEVNSLGEASNPFLQLLRYLSDGKQSTSGARRFYMHVYPTIK